MFSGAALQQQQPLRFAPVKDGRKSLNVQLCGGSSQRAKKVTACPASLCIGLGKTCSLRPLRRHGAQPARGRQLVVRATAMVNVDFASPSLLLGTALIGCGVLLLNLRNFQNKVSRDADIVVAAMVSIVGSTLIFQGWRLDPLLLLCQALTTSVAFWYGMETFRLRSKEADMPPAQLPPGVGPDPLMLSMDPAQQAAQQQYYQQGFGVGAGFAPPPPPPGSAYLPPPDESYYPWGTAQPANAAASAAAAAAASTSGRPASPALGPGPYGGPGGGWAPGGSVPYSETIQYDYYGNPIMPQEPMYDSAGPGPAAATQYGEAAQYSTGPAYGAPSPGPSPEPSGSGYGYGYGEAGIPVGGGAGGGMYGTAPAAGPVPYAAAAAAQGWPASPSPSPSPAPPADAFAAASGGGVSAAQPYAYPPGGALAANGNGNGAQPAAAAAAAAPAAAAGAGGRAGGGGGRGGGAPQPGLWDVHGEVDDWE